MMIWGCRVCCIYGRQTCQGGTLKTSHCFRHHIPFSEDEQTGIYFFNYATQIGTVKKQCFIRFDYSISFFSAPDFIKFIIQVTTKAPNILMDSFLVAPQFCLHKHAVYITYLGMSSQLLPLGCSFRSVGDSMCQWETRLHPQSCISTVLSRTLHLH